MEVSDNFLEVGTAPFGVGAGVVEHFLTLAGHDEGVPVDAGLGYVRGVDVVTVQQGGQCRVTKKETRSRTRISCSHSSPPSPETPS